MKFLTDRKEIANEINIKETPVLVMNCKKPKVGWDDCFEGDKVVVNGERCTLHVFSDGENEGIKEPHLRKKIILTSGGIGISNSFGYSDVVEMTEWRKAMRLVEGGEVIVVFDYGTACSLRKMRVGKVSRFCSTVAVLEDVD